MIAGALKSHFLPSMLNFGPQIGFFPVFVQKIDKEL